MQDNVVTDKKRSVKSNNTNEHEDSCIKNSCRNVTVMKARRHTSDKSSMRDHGNIRPRFLLPSLQIADSLQAPTEKMPFHGAQLPGHMGQGHCCPDAWALHYSL